MATWITTADITDKLVQPIVNKNHDYLKRADLEVEALASEHGLEVDDLSNPLSYPVKRWLISQIGLFVCEDHSGIDPQKLFEQGVTEDPYDLKLKYYQKQVKIQRGSITPEMLQDTADTPEEYASSPFELYRG